MPNKKRKCRYCKEYKEVDSGIIINNGFYCSYYHATAYARQNQAKGKAKREKAEKSDLRKRKEKLKSYAKLAAEAEKAVRRYIRARDYGKPCISCGTTNPNIQYAAGHFKTSGGHKELRFNVLNMHLQCNKYCNSALSGNINGNKHTKGYRQGLIDRFGQWIVDYLESHHESKNYSREDLNRIKRIFNKRARFYENRK